jgi:translation initiation factor IF-1
MSKQSMREETERLVKEAMERVAVKQGKTRIDAICGKVRRAKSRLSGARTGPGCVHV